MDRHETAGAIFVVFGEGARYGRLLRSKAAERKQVLPPSTELQPAPNRYMSKENSIVDRVDHCMLAQKGHLANFMFKRFQEKLQK